MYLIGLTGGIACGKSTVDQQLAALGAVILDADVEVHRLLMPGEALFEQYIHHFGPQVKKEDGTLDRRRIGSLVFKNPSELRWIHEEIHPRIKATLLEKIEAYRESGTDVLVLDIPLLFECGWNQKVDQVWVVWVSPSVQLKRLRERNHLSVDEAKARIRAQMPLQEKKDRADVLIDNSGSRQKTQAQVKAAWEAVRLR